MTDKYLPQTAPIGDAVLKILNVVYRTSLPLLLEGPTGIGKSQIVELFTKQEDLDLVILDLSLLEPPDLIGLPVIENNRTRYATPASLPQSGKGILMLEELNRAETPVMQPALQLLSARRLNDYILPEGWLCVAAINPEDEDYLVNVLDPALRSRFMQLRVTAETASWLKWAEDNAVHPVILDIVRFNPDVFAAASPRSWDYASRVISELTADELADENLLLSVLCGYLPFPWAVHVGQCLNKEVSPVKVDLETLIDRENGIQQFAEKIEALEAEGRSDVVIHIAKQIQDLFEQNPEHASTIPQVYFEELLSVLPGDLREQCLAALGRTLLA